VCNMQDFAWVHTEKIKHFHRCRLQCLPSKKDRKYRSVMKALAAADEIDNDPRDMTKKQASDMLALLDSFLLPQRVWAQETSRRLAHTIDPGLAEREKRAKASLPIWARN
jgi:hypothetical protein